MTREPEPNTEPEATPELPAGDLTEDAVDAWFAGQHHDMGLDLAAVIDLEAGLRDIHLAGQHRDTGTDLTSTLDLSTGLAAILPVTSQHLVRPAQFDTFTDLLNWLAATPTTRLAHRARLRWLAGDIEILHLVTSSNTPDHNRDLTLASALANDLARTRALELTNDLASGSGSALARALARALALARDLTRIDDLANDLLNDHSLALELCQLLCEATVRFEVTDLLRKLNAPAALTTSRRIVSSIDTREHSRLRSLADNFVGADLHQTDITGLDLIGVQWSRTTHWPPQTWTGSPQPRKPSPTATT